MGGTLKVAYVLRSFPEASETFVSDEIASLKAFGVAPMVLAVNPGGSTVLHGSAKAVLERSPFRVLGEVTRFDMVAAMWALFRKRPMRTLRGLLRVVLDSDRWYRLRSLPGAVWCLEHGAHMLHAHFADVNLRYAAAIAEWTGLPYGVTTHRYDILDDPIGADVAKRLLHEASLVITISEFNRQWMLEKYALPLNATQVVHCGVDLERFEFIQAPVRPLTEPIRLLNIGRLVTIKAQDVLLDALAQVRQQGVSFSMDIIGEGELRGPLEAQIQRLKLGDVVHLHGAQPSDVVRRFLSQADLFVLSSRSEGLPVVCIEALATGVPVVATRINGIPELIEDNVSGWLVPPDDAPALAAGIVKAAESRAVWSAIRQAGRQAVESAFDRAKCTADLVSAWRECLKARSL